MATSAITQAANTAATQTANSKTSTENAMSKLSGDYTMFLKLLTSQMTNQDPLNPMDTSQYTQQLVQYSQVEQTIQQSGTLKQILERLSNQDMIQASSLIGRTVNYSGATSGLSADQPANWNLSTDRAATTLTATITNAAGKTVDVRTLDPGSKSFSWDGTLANGSRAADGLYTLSLEAKDSNSENIATKVNGFGLVQAVSMVNNAMMLSINGQQQAASDVIQVK